MLDVSDGLVRDAGRLARASGVTFDLDDPAESFPGDLAALAPAGRALGDDAVAWVLAGGEDHGLLATFPAGVGLPAPFRPVGRVVPRVEAAPVLVDGAAVGGAVGWDHFRR